VVKELRNGSKQMAEASSSGKATVEFPGDTQILVTRKFEAPSRLVYEAWTTPELIKQWWSGDRGEVTNAELDLRTGGTWRYVMTGSDGSEVVFHGEYREIVPAERIVSTEMYEGMPEAGAVNTVMFDEKDGHTTLTLLVQHVNQEYLKAHINSGVEASMQTAMDHLEQVVVSLR
jgi:uncharacterized protein YndB with AHSA1/START domain